MLNRQKGFSFLVFFITIIVFLVVVWAYVFGAKISEPPKLDVPRELNQYLKTIYDNFDLLEAVTINPDGSRIGKFGQIILFNNSGTYYIEVCTSSPSGKVWRGVVLTDTP